MTSFQLSKGTLKEIFSKAGFGKPVKQIVVQITNMKAIDTINNQRKYRVLITDGIYSTHGLIDEKCTPYLENNNCTRYATIQINKYTLLGSTKHFVLIEDFEILNNKGEKTVEKPIGVDDYFAEHPDEGHFQIAKKQDSMDSGARNESPAPTRATPPVAHSTYSNEMSKYPKPRGAPAGSGAPAPRISPIETLSPYQNNWTIKARVSYKGDLRTWSNAKGEGKVSSINFLDESDEIKASAFNETAERAHNLLEEGKVYYISKAKVSAARKKFNNLSHPYELQLDKDTEITECFDESDVPKLSFNFVKLDQIQNLEQNAIVDVMGALKIVNPSFQITAKSTGKAFDRRDITIVDETGFAIDVGLWNNTALDFNVEEGTVIAFKGCKVSDFNGRTLGLTQSGSLIPNPGTPESYQLKGWYDNIGVKENNYKSLKNELGSGGLSAQEKIAQRKLIAQAEEENIGANGGDKPEYFTTKASFSYSKPDNFAYPACNNRLSNSGDSTRPANPCNKKLAQLGDKWSCERCNIEYDEPTWRYILNCAIMDSSGQIWVTLFDEQAKKLLGMDANQLMQLSQEEAASDKNPVAEVMQKNYFKEFNFRIRAKQDTFNDQLKIRYQCVGLFDVDFNAECEYLCRELDATLA
ncbi:uncharacterized protein LODBEIA_P45260 [Lodderomyces beijingensis]|uniref:Replication protein A subunit n=1 Tax=Lodderomyces beijingensis TaxID=1775926 RepID=A0ABP0ZQ93_9ASCO